MPDKIEWNIYSEMDIEIAAIWQLVQETLILFNLAKPEFVETGCLAVRKFGEHSNAAPLL